MKVSQDLFGHIGETPIHQITLRNKNGLEVTALTYGCIISRLMTPDSSGHVENCVLGFDTIEEYQELSPYFGAVCGRVAGRIKEGTFELEGKTHHLDQNDGKNHLHGGSKGFDKQIWGYTLFEEADEAGVTFTLTFPDGEDGYPGTLEMSVTYLLNEQNELTVKYEGVSDASTLLNVTNHSYFNLSGNLKQDILQHTLYLKSNQYIELGDDLLPTGDLIDVEGTPFDFRQGKQLKEGILSSDKAIQLADQGYDHPFLLATHFNNEIKVVDETSGRTLTVETDQPSVVVYTSNHLTDDFSIRGVKARKYMGLCLETQVHPDAIHHPHFPSIVLEKGDRYSSQTTYSFSTISR